MAPAAACGTIPASPQRPGGRLMPSPRALLLYALVAAPLAAADKPSAEGVRFFETKVRPVLVEHCYRCHGPDKQRGGLRVDSLAALKTGGETGPALHPGDPGKSLLIAALKH